MCNYTLPDPTNGRLSSWSCSFWKHFSIITDVWAVAAFPWEWKRNKVLVHIHYQLWCGKDRWATSGSKRRHLWEKDHAYNGINRRRREWLGHDFRLWLLSRHTQTSALMQIEDASYWAEGFLSFIFFLLLAISHKRIPRQTSRSCCSCKNGHQMFIHVFFLHFLIRIVAV